MVQFGTSDGDHSCAEDFWEKADSKTTAMFAAQNVSSKGHLGRFLAVSIIRTKLLEEGILSSRVRKGKKRCLDA